MKHVVPVHGIHATRDAAYSQAHEIVLDNLMAGPFTLVVPTVRRVGKRFVVMTRANSTRHFGKSFNARVRAMKRIDRARTIEEIDAS